MKRTLIILLLLVVSFATIESGFAAVKESVAPVSSTIYDRLKSLKDVVSVEKLGSDIFKEKYLIRVKQLVDPKDPSAGEFTQRVVVGHVSDSAPTVLITEGYSGAYGLNPKYRDEISKKLNANQVVVEHRYFEESTPEPCDWSYMTGENAANDLHKITTLLKEIYSGKWISTGISKGGQNCMIYRSYFPDDIDVSVPYVGPVCFGVEDRRHESFILNAGTPLDQERILAIQREVLTRKAALVPMLKELAEKKGWNFKELSLEEVIDYCVLEYPFSSWQWGRDTSKIPDPKNSTDKEIFDHLMVVAGADYFGAPSYTPFFVQAATDLGYYSYNTKPVKDLLTIKSTKGYLKWIFLPEEIKDTKFDNYLHKHIYKFLKENDPKMIFIYGEFDPWTAVAPKDKLFKGKENMVKYIDPNGSHRARIGTMPQDVQDEIWNKINNWLK